MEGNELIIEADRIYGDEDLDNGDDTYDLIDNMPNQADTDWGYGSLPDVDTAEKKAFRQQYFNEQEHKRLEKENPFAYRMMSGAVMTLLTLLIVGIIGNAVSFGAAYSGAGAVATGTGSAGGGAAAKIVHELAKDGDVTNEIRQAYDALASDGDITNELKVTSDGIKLIEKHLQNINALNDPSNQAMLSRLKDGMRTIQDITFYQHELIEYSLMKGGLDPRTAHLKTLSLQGIQYVAGYEALIYHPDVIRTFSEFFNPKAWPTK